MVNWKYFAKGPCGIQVNRAAKCLQREGLAVNIQEMAASEGMALHYLTGRRNTEL